MVRSCLQSNLKAMLICKAAQREEDVPGLLMVEVAEETVSVEVVGPVEFVFTIGQQLAWLSSTCRFADHGPCYADVILFSESAAHSARTIMGFGIDIVGIDEDEGQLCWHSLTGDSVITSGFPTAGRGQEDKGLQIPLGIMAALGGISYAMDAGSGYVLRGENVAFVPVARRDDHVQWHLVRCDEGAKSYSELAEQSQTLGEQTLFSTTVFLGWTMQVLNYVGECRTARFYNCMSTKSLAIGTKAMVDREISWSSLPEAPSTTFTPSNVAVTFSRYLGLGLTFTINRRNIPPLVNKDPDYHDILHELSEMSVVFYDNATDRAWLIDAERAVLQILQHSYRARPGHFKPGVDLAFARHDDHTESVRAVMMANGTKVIRESLDAETGQKRNITFSKSVKDLWEKLKNLRNIAQEEYQKSLHSSDFHLGKRALYGFEYMGLVQSTAELEKHPVKTRLMSGCSQWPDLTDSLGATVLVGKNFQEILLPQPGSVVCPDFYRPPSGMSYLGADARIIHRLADRHGARGHLFRLTPSDLTWTVESPFSTCTAQDVGYCSCNLIQELKRVRNIRDTETTDTLGSWQNGAIIFGNRGSRSRKRRNGAITFENPNHHITRRRIDADPQPRRVKSGRQVPVDTLLDVLRTREITAGPAPAEDQAQDIFDEDPTEAAEGGVEALSPRDKVRQHWSNIDFNS